MRRWDLETSEAQMRSAMEDLQRAWQIVSESWNDEVSRQFAERHLQPLVPISRMSLDAITRMKDLVARIQRECEESSLNNSGPL